MTDHRPLLVRRITPIGDGMRLSREDLEDAGFVIPDSIPDDATFTLKLVTPGADDPKIPTTDQESWRP